MRSAEIENILYNEDLCKEIKNFCLMVPYVKAGVPFKGRYAVIFDDWDVINKLSNKSLPELCVIIFGSEYTENIL